MAAFAPRNPIELDLVEKIIEAKWLMNRLTKIENRTLSMEISLQRQQRMGKVEPPADYTMREATLSFFALAKMRGGPKALAAIVWPEHPIEEVNSEHTQFRRIPMESPELQNEAPLIQPRSEISETKPPQPMNSNPIERTSDFTPKE